MSTWIIFCLIYFKSNQPVTRQHDLLETFPEGNRLIYLCKLRNDRYFVVNYQVLSATKSNCLLWSTMSIA